jgi:hypothetical protein
MTDRRWWGFTRGETALVLLSLAFAGSGLGLITARVADPLGSILLLIGVCCSTTLTFRQVARKNREEAEDHARERAARTRSAD